MCCGVAAFKIVASATAAFYKCDPDLFFKKKKKKKTSVSLSTDVYMKFQVSCICFLYHSESTKLFLWTSVYSLGMDGIIRAHFCTQTKVMLFASQRKDGNLRSGRLGL